MALLNKSIARHGKVESIGVEIICNNATYVTVLVSKHFNGLLYEFNACFGLPIALMAIQ